MNCAPSKLPTVNKPDGGKETANATAAKIESTENAKSTISTFKTVIQKPLPAFFGIFVLTLFIALSYKCLLAINNKYAAPIACTCHTSTRKELMNNDPNRSIKAPASP